MRDTDFDFLLTTHSLAAATLATTAADAERLYLVGLAGKPGNGEDGRRVTAQVVDGAATSADIITIVQRAAPYVAVVRVARKANEFLRQLPSAIESLTGSGRDGLPTELEAFGETFESMATLFHVIDPQTKRCDYQRCPQFLIMSRAIHDTIKVLRSTKNQFKSKELGELRQKLETVLQHGVFSEGEPPAELR